MVVQAVAAEQPDVTNEMIRQAAWISGVELTDEEISLMQKGVGELQADFAKLREVALDIHIGRRRCTRPKVGLHLVEALDEIGLRVVEVLDLEGRLHLEEGHCR